LRRTFSNITALKLEELQFYSKLLAKTLPLVTFLSLKAEIMTKFAFTTLVLFSLFFSIFCVAAQDIEPRRVEGNRTIERIPVLEAKDLARAAQYSNLRSASNSSWHPAGNALLIGTRFSETRQLHLVSSAIGTRQQLTFFNEPIDEANYSPVDNRILYNRDKGGDENYQAFLLDIESGLTRQLTT
jgi:hypothetical protein